MIVRVGKRRGGNTTWLLSTAIRNAIRHDGSISIVIGGTNSMSSILLEKTIAILCEKFSALSFSRSNHNRQIVLQNSSRFLFYMIDIHQQLPSITHFGKNKCFAYFDEFDFFTDGWIIDCSYITDAYFCESNAFLFKKYIYKCKFDGIGFIDKIFLANLWRGMFNYATKETIKIELDECQNDKMCKRCEEKCCINHGLTRVVSESCPYYAEMYLLFLRQQNVGVKNGNLCLQQR